MAMFSLLNTFLIFIHSFLPHLLLHCMISLHKALYTSDTIGWLLLPLTETNPGPAPANCKERTRPICRPIRILAISSRGTQSTSQSFYSQRILISYIVADHRRFLFKIKIKVLIVALIGTLASLQHPSFLHSNQLPFPTLANKSFFIFVGNKKCKSSEPYKSHVGSHSMSFGCYSDWLQIGLHDQSEG